MDDACSTEDFVFVEGRFGLHLQHTVSGLRVKVHQFVVADQDNRGLPGARGVYLNYTNRVWWVAMAGVDHSDRQLELRARDWYLEHWAHVKLILPLTPFNPQAALVNVVPMGNKEYVCLHNQSTRFCRDRAELDAYLSDHGLPIQGTITQAYPPSRANK